LDLQEHADYVRSLISRLDATEGFDESALKEVIGQVEEVAARLLGIGKADAQLKAEVISWVVRFRQERGRLARAQVETVVISPPARAPRTVARQLPVTRTFDYDTRDPRTRGAAFVKERPGRRRPAVNKPYALGTDPNAMAFANMLDRLRVDINDQGPHALGSPEANELLLKVLELHKTYKARLHWKFWSRVGEELDTMALRVGGQNLRKITEKHRGPRLHQGVPAEIGPIFSRQVVSGGLPTLGRGRR
jgi:hypothetical protein